MSNLVAIQINDQAYSIEIKEYKGQRVVTFRDIDYLHGRVDGTARKRFNDNKKRFIKGEDYFVRNSDEAKKEFGIVAPNGLILITQTGYLMLVKSFNDDLAWQVQRQLVNTYFKGKQLATSVKSVDPLLAEAKKQNAEARLRNAKVREANFILKAVSTQVGILSQQAVELLTINALEMINGKNTLPRPKIEKLYTAGEIALEAGKGMSANMIGRIAMKHGLKTDQYGAMVLDKSPHSSKQVEAFRYNEDGRKELLRLAAGLKKE